MTTTPVPTCTDDLLAEIDVPRYDCTSGGVTFCKGCYRMEECEYGDYISVVDYAALLARLHAAEKDAGRYRWLSENSSVILNQHARFKAESGTLIESTMPSRRELNAAIDAAMEASK